MIIIFAGALGRFPVGGHAWIEMQYLLALRSLGHDVFFLEDCGEGSWVYNWETEQITTDLKYPTSYIRQCLDPIGFSDQWIYRAGNNSVGMRLNDFLEVCSQADLLLIRASPITLWRPEYNLPLRRIFIDADPGFTQLKVINGNRDLISTVKYCEHLFTIGQKIGDEDCLIPSTGIRWQKTVSPIFLPHWPLAENNLATHFTSIMQWRSYEDIVFQGVTYGNKDKEFPKFLELPRTTEQRFCIALTGGFPKDLSQYGWEVRPGWVASFTPSSYYNFIQNSRAEFSVAKHGYVISNSGWFSDRSVCYLASGRPVLVQDTGQGDWLPIGEGIVTFRNFSEALKGIETINADYNHHRRAARALAEQYFEADKVLAALLEKAMA
jgi:hypothetical protein